MLMYYYLFDLLNYQMFHNEKVTLIAVVRNSNLLEIDKHILQTYHIHLLMEIYQENNLSGTSLQI